ncbi:MAG: phospho-N-acetylmuramoyl-pentapeptide-transferase [Betaproteobacteria bacterium AqS2]|uniref:Phospho-N-acetylmuramoyl-pentapeptide-transferase n=1 Tax=Candidatus Amphirhobacter heronislandensis TaxID=1732024 RepID=A0A930XY21_9GAMM|nr:phospho-N-acetylmuramoyl-pentapeptide-transferase [Betaproteobacteria bacterium AqS2]
MYRAEHGVFNLLTYVTSRSVFAALTGMAIGMLAYPPFIRWQRGAALGERVRDDGPDSHQAKEGTPTMGGVVILVALLAASLLWGDLGNPLLLVALTGMVLFAGIGLADDWGKSRSQARKGMTARRKIALQAAAGALVLVLMWAFTGVSEQPGLLIPYWKDLVLPLGAVGFFIIGWLCIVGASNAVNLTDGLDGLAILPTVIVASGLAVLAYVAGHEVFAQYLDLPRVAGAQELVIFLAALAGASLAFLWFNAGPAQVFMGDTGALGIGAALACVAVVIRQEVVFAIMGGLFVLEAVSVMIQVASYKLTGRRVFRMAPLHHHFEEKGWPENVVVVRFWIITIASPR